MASLQARHSRRCALGRVTDKADQIRKGCTCRNFKPSGLLYFIRQKDENGRFVQIPAGTDKRKAEEALVRLQAKVLDQGSFLAPSKLTAAEWLDEWHAGLIGPSENTRRSYSYTVAYAKKAFGSKKVRDLRPADVTRFLEVIREAKSGPTTQAKHLRVLHACLAEAVREGHLSRNPVADLGKQRRPKVERREAAYFTDDEIPRLVAAIDNPLYRTLVKTALLTGMRAGELAALTWANVDLTAATIYVRASWTDGRIGLTKNRHARDVELTPETVTLLGEWWAECGKPTDDDTLVFAAPTKDGYLNTRALPRRVLYPSMVKAKIPRECPEGRARGVKRTFHSLRHTHARVALERGADLTWISRHLGHSGIGITEGIYGHWSKAASKAQAANLEGAFNV